MGRAVGKALGRELVRLKEKAPVKPWAKLRSNPMCGMRSEIREEQGRNSASRMGGVGEHPGAPMTDIEL